MSLKGSSSSSIEGLGPPPNILVLGYQKQNKKIRKCLGKCPKMAENQTSIKMTIENQKYEFGFLLVRCSAKTLACDIMMCAVWKKTKSTWH